MGWIGVLGTLTGFLPSLVTHLLSRRRDKELGAQLAQSDRALEALRGEFEHERDDNRRRSADAQEQAGYREPLARAAEDLASRLREIEDPVFSATYREHGDRADLLVQTTLYRLARFFGLVEAVENDHPALLPGTPEENAAVTALIEEIREAFATDRYGSRFLLWRDEQRIVGEACLAVGSGRRELVGYAEFVRRLEGEYCSWFRRLDGELRSQPAGPVERFEAVREALGALARRLRAAGDPTGAHVAGEAVAGVIDLGDQRHARAGRSAGPAAEVAPRREPMARTR